MGAERENLVLILTRGGMFTQSERVGSLFSSTKNEAVCSLTLSPDPSEYSSDLRSAPGEKRPRDVTAAARFQPADLPPQPRPAVGEDVCHSKTKLKEDH